MENETGDPCEDGNQHREHSVLTLKHCVVRLRLQSVHISHFQHRFIKLIKCINNLLVKISKIQLKTCF